MNDAVAIKDAVVDYAQNTTASEFGEDVKNATTNVETYENLAGGFIFGTALSKINKLGTISKTTSSADNVVGALGKSKKFNVTATEGNLNFISTKIAGKNIEFGGEFFQKDGVLTIKNFDVDGNLTNELGVKGVRNLINDFGKELGVSKIIIFGSKRTTGANPGKVTNIEFNIK